MVDSGGYDEDEAGAWDFAVAVDPPKGVGAVLDKGGYELLAGAEAFAAPKGVGAFEDIGGKAAEFVVFSWVLAEDPNGVGACFAMGGYEPADDVFAADAPKGVGAFEESGG